MNSEIKIVQIDTYLSLEVEVKVEKRNQVMPLHLNSGKYKVDKYEMIEITYSKRYAKSLYFENISVGSSLNIIDFVELINSFVVNCLDVKQVYTFSDKVFINIHSVKGIPYLLINDILYSKYECRVIVEKVRRILNKCDLNELEV